MPKITVNDISMYYEIHGQGEPIVMISGFGSDHSKWLNIVNLFKDQYQLIVFDNRGSGQTDAPLGDYSIEAMADDVAALCSQLKLSRAHFIGNSMGGFILQDLAFRYPSLVHTAIISHSGPLLPSPFKIYLQAELEFLKTEAPLEAIIKAACSWTFSPQFLAKPGMIEALVRLGLNHPYPFTVKRYESQYAALKQFDSSPWLNDIQAPTLVLASDQDLIFSPEVTQSLAHQMPNAQYYCFSACGHLPHIEYPEKFVRIVQDFLKRTNEPLK